MVYLILLFILLAVFAAAYRLLLQPLIAFHFGEGDPWSSRGARGRRRQFESCLWTAVKLGLASGAVGGLRAVAVQIHPTFNNPLVYLQVGAGVLAVLFALGAWYLWQNPS